MKKVLEKVSQKKLCNIANEIGAIRLTNNNCYQYESYIHDTNKLIDRLDLDIKRDKWGRYLITAWQLYYSSGIYGNSGQLHIINYINNYDVHCSIYVYFTNINYNND